MPSKQSLDVYFTCMPMRRFSGPSATLAPLSCTVTHGEHPCRSTVTCRGDVDGIVPVLGTRRWIEKLDLPIVRRWRPWYSSTGTRSAALCACTFAAFLSPRVFRVVLYT